jgi:fatty-acyl-CoA synthase
VHVGMVLEMASENLADRVAIGSRHGGMTFRELGERARRAAGWLAAAPGDRVVLVDENSVAVPLGLFGAAIAGKPFAPVSYRLPDDQLRAIVARTAPCTLIAGAGVAERVAGMPDVKVVSRQAFLDATTDADVEPLDGWGCDVDAPAVLLFTSGSGPCPCSPVTAITAR